VSIDFLQGGRGARFVAKLASNDRHGHIFQQESNGPEPSKGW